MVIKKGPIMEQSGNSTDSISWSVVFEKVPVQIPSETTVSSDQTAGTSKHSEAFKKIPVHISSGTALNSDQTSGKSRLTMSEAFEKLSLYMSSETVLISDQMAGKSRLRMSEAFEKIPVHISSETALNSDETAGLSKDKMKVTYVKSPKNSKPGSVTCTEAKETSDCGDSPRTPKKPKVNVQKALQLAATDNIKLDKVLNLNQSLRSKKKNKKRKKPELKKAKKDKGASSSSCSSRDSSRDRDKIKGDMAAAYVPQAPKVAKRPSGKISESPIKNTHNSRLTSDALRKEKLMEALSVPVQSDKALRMMFGMGWSGGALGTRGDGLTEPLMPSFEIPKGAGFGLVRHRQQNANPVTVSPLPKKPKDPTPTFVAEKNIVMQRTKKLVPEDVTFDKIMKHPPNPTTSKVELSIHNRFSIETIEPNRKPFRLEILHGVWDLINSDASIKCLNYETTLNKKQVKFVKSAMQILSGKKGKLLSCFQPEELPMCQKIRERYEEIQIVVEARFSLDFRSLDLLKVLTVFIPRPPKRNKQITATITDDKYLRMKTYDLTSSQ